MNLRKKGLLLTLLILTSMNLLASTVTSIRSENDDVVYELGVVYDHIEKIIQFDGTAVSRIINPRFILKHNEIESSKLVQQSYHANDFFCEILSLGEAESIVDEHASRVQSVKDGVLAVDLYGNVVLGTTIYGPKNFLVLNYIDCIPSR